MTLFTKMVGNGWSTWQQLAVIAWVWTGPLIWLMRARVGNQVALQGNMDPSILYGSDERIRDEVHTILDSFGHGNGHVFNLGHGIHQFVDPAKAKVFIEAVHEFSPDYRFIVPLYSGCKMITASQFQPRWWLRNSHVQTLLGSFIGKNSGITTQRERVELTDGDFLILTASISIYLTRRQPDHLTWS